jgi:hypothetical protein
MFKMIAILWNNVFAPKDWSPHGDRVARKWIMRRWRDGNWEQRPCTPDEEDDAAAWQSIR